MKMNLNSYHVRNYNLTKYITFTSAEVQWGPDPEAVNS